MTEAPFSLNDLLAFLEKQEDTTGYFSTREWQDMLGATQYRMRQIMRTAKAQGVLERMNGYREAYDGSQRMVPLFRFKWPMEEGEG